MLFSTNTSFARDDNFYAKNKVVLWLHNYQKRVFSAYRMLYVVMKCFFTLKNVCAYALTMAQLTGQYLLILMAI